MSKTARNNLIRCVVFLIILGGVFYYLNNVFSIAESEESKKNFNSFYSEKENTLDGVYFGASSVNRYWVAPKAYEETGIAIYNLGTSSQPLVVTKSLMEETLKTQNPKIFIVELRWLVRSADRIEEPYIRKVTDSMKFSSTRKQAIDESVDFALKGDNGVVDNKLDYYFPIIKYHDRWNGDDMTSDDLKISGERQRSKGFFLTPAKSYVQTPVEPAVIGDETEPLAEESLEMFENLLDYCDSIDTEVLFVLSPHSVKKENLGRLNEASRIAQDRGFDVLNFNTHEMIEAVGIDWNKDFFNPNHTNIIGAEKYTSYLAYYLSENYELPDRRGDENYESWQEAYDYYVQTTGDKRENMEE